MIKNWMVERLREEANHTVYIETEHYSVALLPHSKRDNAVLKGGAHTHYIDLSGTCIHASLLCI